MFNVRSRAVVNMTMTQTMRIRWMKRTVSNHLHAVPTADEQTRLASAIRRFVPLIRLRLEMFNIRSRVAVPLEQCDYDTNEACWVDKQDCQQPFACRANSRGETLAICFRSTFDARLKMFNIPVGSLAVVLSEHYDHYKSNGHWVDEQDCHGPILDELQYSAENRLVPQRSIHDSKCST
jgi:hypothetical protein